MRTIGTLAVAAVLVAGAGIATAEMTDEERAVLETSSGRSSLEEEVAEAGSQPSSLEEETVRGTAALGGSSLAEGRKLYKEGNYTLALERLLTAHTSDPDDPEASLMLGLTYLQLDDPGKAAIHWADYVKDSADRKLAGDVSKYVTILLHEANHRAAREAIEREKDLSQMMTSPRTVAVGAFRNLGSAEYAPLGKALAAMLIDNLQGVPDVQVLEREQVEALVDEANLAEKGLVEQSTAVRAGKLLRAGTVAAGSHIDYTASPTRLKVESVLVDVDDASELASASEENLVDAFYDIIPKIAAEFAPILTKKPVAELPPEQAARVTEEHTKSLPAALAFGRALDAKDRKDSEEALRNCRDAEKADPDFELAKRTCGLIPPVWMSSQGVVSTVESQVLVTTASLGATAAPWIVGGLVVAGAAAGGAVAASGGGDDGGDDAALVNEPGGNNAPGLNGVPSNANVQASRTLTFDVSSNDPDGQNVTLTAENLPPGASFNQASGALVNGRFRWTPDCNQLGVFTVRFCATDDGNPPAQTCRDTRIQVSECPPEEEPTPEPTTVPCDAVGEECNPNNPSQCCTGQCGETDNNGGDVDTCCIPLGDSCAGASGDCCGFEAECFAGNCCISDFEFGCEVNSDCCSGDCVPSSPSGFCSGGG